MKNLITELESKVKDCNNTNSIFNTNKYVLLKDAKELLKQAINFTHCYTELPTKQYEIDFDGNVKAGIDITNNKINIVGAMNGWGNRIDKETITITEL